MLSRLILLIVLNQFGKGFEIDSPVNHFQCHSQRHNHPEGGVHGNVFPCFQVDDGFTAAPRFFRELLLTVVLRPAQLPDPLAKSRGSSDEQNVTYTELLMKLI